MDQDRSKVDMRNKKEDKFKIYIGTYNEPIMTGDGSVFRGKGRGIEIYSMDVESGTVTHLSRNRETSNTSWIECSADGKTLYAVNELDEFEGKETGAVSSYLIEEDRSLKLCRTLSSGGRAPCHLGISPDGRGMAVANYISGNLVLYRLKGDGMFEQSQQIELEGKGPDSIRQAGPHAHCVLFDRTGSHLLVTNLGDDTIHVFTYKKDESKIEEGSVSTLSYQKTSGWLTCIQNSPVNEWKNEGDRDAAGLVLSPDGQNLYVTTRNINRLTGFHRAPQTGLLKYIQSIKTDGVNPRSLAIAPNGKWLVVGNQDTDNITIYKRDSEDGNLHVTEKLQVNTPVCVRIF